MSTRYTKSDVRSMVESLETMAKTVGVMPDHAKLSYSAGNASQGYAAHIDCYAENDNGHRNAVSVRFVPQFTYKSTLREQSKMIEATFNALHAVSML